MCRCPVCQAVGPGEFWGASQPSTHPDVTFLPTVLAPRLSCWQQGRSRALSCGGGSGGAGQWEASSHRGQWGYQQATVLPTGDQPDASLPLHVLPLYSLLAPEKQAQVTAWSPGCLLRVSGWGQGRPRVIHPIAVGPAPPGSQEGTGTSPSPAFSWGAPWPPAGSGHVHCLASGLPSLTDLSDQGTVPGLSPHKSVSHSGAALLPPLPPRSSSRPRRGFACASWPPTWPRRPSPSQASSMWWTAGR